jgi:hypothetical protein
MAASTNLVDRIEAEFAAADKRAKEVQSRHVQDFQGRQQRLEKLTQLLDKLRDIWRPRLEALAKKFGERVNVRPQVEPGQRSATFEFKSDLARVKLRFAVAPDTDVRNLVFTYDLDIVPILMKFDRHDEIEIPLDGVDESTIGQWFDDRIVSFVQTYLSLHENQYYLKDHMVEDPIAKVRFPKYAAGATLEVNRKMIYFLDDTTLREYQQKQSTKK